MSPRPNEETSLKLLLEFVRPNDLDAKQRLADVLRLQGKLVPEELSKSLGAIQPRLEDVLSHISDGMFDKEEINAAVNFCSRTGLIPPLELQKSALEVEISEDPSRIDLKRNLAIVCNRLGIDVPIEILDDVKASYISEEHGTDFQQMMQIYGDKVGVSDLEEDFFDDLERVRQFTMTSVERLYSLWDSVRYVARAGLDGDLVEAGVWRGGSVMLMALALIRAKKTESTLWLFDTFAGLPRPDPELDIDILGNRAIDGWTPRSFSEDQAHWAYADEADVRANMARTDYPQEKLRFVVGKVEKTIPDKAPEKISLLRIDTDWHASYDHILPHLYDRVVPGGIIIFDDYGQFLGARKAVDDFIANKNIVSPMIRVDYSCRMMIKI
jgi:O-methyltransferase